MLSGRADGLFGLALWGECEQDLRLMNVFGLILLLIVTLALLGFVTLLVLIALRYRHWSAELGLPAPRAILGAAEHIGRWARWLEGRFTAPSARLLSLAHGHLVSQYMMVVVRSGIADAFGSEARPAAAVASQLKLHPGTVAHMLRVLAGHGCFEIVAGTEHMVRHNSVSALLRADHPQSLRPMMLLLAETYVTSGSAPQMAASGVPSFVASTGGGTFAEATFARHGEPEGRLCSGASMLQAAEASLFRLSEGGLLVDYPWRNHRRIVDFSRSHGRFLSSVLKANRGVSGLVWEDAAVSAATQVWWTRVAEAVGDRVTFMGSAGVDDLPALRSGDGLLLGFVLSALDDLAAVEMLIALRRQIGALEVSLLIADTVLDERECARPKLVMDAQMRGLGALRYRPRSAWQALLLKGGFSIAHVTRCRGYASVIQGTPVDGVALGPASASAAGHRGG
jgi:hypothetical protein